LVEFSLYKKIGPNLAQILNNEARDNCLCISHQCCMGGTSQLRLSIGRQ
jgi:hypothetical protein